MATAPPAPPAATAGPSRLTRPKDDRVLSGVCSGLARHFGTDVALVRTVAVILTLIGGVGLLIYIAALVLVPEDGSDQPFARSGRLDEDDRAPLILGGLVLAGIVLGAGPLPWDPWNGGPWLLVVAVGFGLVFLAVRHDRAGGRSAVATPPPPPATANGRATPTGPAPGTSTAGDDTDPTTTRTTEDPATDMTPAAIRTHEADTEVLHGPPPPDPPRRPRAPTRAILGAVLLALGTLGLLMSSFDLDLATDTAIAIAVLACGAGAVAAAPFGGARLLLLLGFVTASVGGFVAATDLDLDGGIGERRERPATVAAFPADGYRLGIGDQRVDLREVTFPFGTTTLKVRQGIGELRVQIPAGVAVVARGRATGGELRILGRDEEGGNPDLEVESPVRSDRRRVVDAELTFGEIRIEQDGVDEGEIR